MNARTHFHDRIRQLCHCEDVPLDIQEQVLAALCELARTIELTEEECKSVPEGYAARILDSDQAGWTLELIVLPPGQQTPPHDHVSWGAAATVQGIERNRWFAGTCPDALYLLGEHEVPPRQGYLFSGEAIHQAIGADPDRTTLALHFLVRGFHGEIQHCREGGTTWKKA
jgi:predicted metal-dependent enzyme (double-stranded beta helix superfamily)